jgi:Cu/Ag efflux protein CusF
MPGQSDLTMEAAGQVVSVDPATKTLVVKSDTGAMTFAVQDRVMTELQSLKPGDKVTVQYTEDAGKNRAEAIRKG